MTDWGNGMSSMGPLLSQAMDGHTLLVLYYYYYYYYYFATKTTTTTVTIVTDLPQLAADEASRTSLERT